MLERLGSRLEDVTQRPIAQKAGAIASALVISSGVAACGKTNTINNSQAGLEALAQLYDVEPQAITGEGLAPVKPLQGKGNQTTQAEQNELKAATVAMLQAKPGDRFWTEEGSGTNVTYKGNEYVLTALHLFSYNFPSPSVIRPADALTGDNYDYAIGDPILTGRQREHDNILGKVTGAAFEEYPTGLGPDAALLNIQPVVPTLHQRNWQSLSSIPMQAHFLPQPRPGQQVYMYSVPGEGHGINSTGIYLGQALLPVEVNLETVDIVGLNPSNSSHDVCEHGASGSSFIAPDGYVSGPAFYRAPLDSEQVPLGERQDATKEIATRWHIQDALHANLSAYTVLCAFTVIPPAEPAGLVKGFGVQENPNRR